MTFQLQILGWLIFFQGGYEEAIQYTSQSNKKIMPICPDCGRIKDKLTSISNIYYNRSIGCVCGDGLSYPNKFSYAFLEQLPIDVWVNEYTPKWANGRRYDNYFEYKGNKYILEMDGSFHSKDNPLNGMTSNEAKLIDNYKDSLAEKHGIHMIRIDCLKSNKEYITDNIKKSAMNDMFDLSNIDWNKCDEFAIKNIAKEICQYYKCHEEMSIVELSNLFHIERHVVSDYIRSGCKYGWCRSKEEIILERNTKIYNEYKNGNSIKFLAKKYNVDVDTIKRRILTVCKDYVDELYPNDNAYIKVYDENNNFIQEYIGLQKFIINSENVLGVKIAIASLYNSIKNHKSYKGFYFEIQ